jgi:hypothetical protein
MGKGKSRASVRASFDRLLLRVVFLLAGPGRTPGGGRPTGILHVFVLAERLLQPQYRAYPPHAGGVLSFEIGRLPWGTRPLPLNPPVHARDRIIRLHFNNRTLAQLSTAHTSRRHLAWEVARRTEQDLTALAGMVKSGAFPDGTRAVWAETVIYRAMARVGFELRAAKPGLRRPFARLYFLTLMAIYGPPGFIDRDPEQLEHYQLGEAWMDLRDLVLRYGPGDD